MGESVNIRELNDLIASKSNFVSLITRGMDQTIVGQKHLVDSLLISLLANGHVLLEGVPGLAKTLAIKTLASIIDAKYSRIQFTPDLLPADVVGTMVYSVQKEQFEVKKGPVFANFVLADEINRAPAKVQSALLEAMQERQVTIGDKTFALDDPFLVLATQNPIEQEGTYPLPEAQVDRFLMKVVIGYPNKEEEKQIIRMNIGSAEPQVQPLVTPRDIVETRSIVNQIYIDEKIEKYIVDIVFATRFPGDYGLNELKSIISFSVFPVGSKVLAVRDLYGGSFRWFNQVEQEGRFHFTYANTEEELIAELEKDVDVLYIETPTNPLMLEFDIAKLAKLAHAKGAKVVVDNTFYSPIYQRPIEDGVDIVLHSATKYLAGHNDVLAGVVVTNSLELYEQLFYNLNTTGAVLSPFDSYQLIRGLKTLPLRMERSTANAQEVVAFLKDSPAVKEVLYTGRGGMISFKVVDEKRVPRILNSLKVFSFAESLGGVESLITYPTTQTHADIPAEVRHSYGLTDDLLRLSIGIEDARDLIADLRQALEG